ncbi:endolytic transglycosylase MltG [Marininema halotolerans]|uniref:Endolytic murein transglycosylase n=1 Tax=Marininema halotolerans TaxID=1155944 RepID=A0A1I6U7U3_9BACL|nr:endolytic transglycosylase MltG [Marininema halotolerans]SFS97526.1 UPF0755 protein [Marininema halotolerans]
MKWLMRILYTLALFTAWSVLAYFYVDHSLSSPKREHPVPIEIKRGISSTQIGEMLEEKGLIRNDWLFSTYAFITGKADGLQAGVYEIPPNLNVNGILNLITQGKTNVYTVTIPEGFTVDQIATVIDKKGYVSKEDFLQAVQRGTYHYAFLKDLPDNPKRKYRLEGYLFPTTYNIPKNAKAENVVNLMLGQFETRIKPEGVMGELKAKDLTLDKWITVASIVEREGQEKTELPRIAGVIYNRLDKDMRLQVDATIQYARGEQKERLSYDDLKLSSVYNTYKVKGLPPGAIANPGESAINAALFPEKHHYLYYVTKKDGSHEHYFAETFKQHRYYIKKSKTAQPNQHTQ